MNHKKRIISLILILSILILFSFLPKHIGRYFYWNLADLNDYKKFPSLPIEKGNNSFTFYESEVNAHLKIPEKFNSRNKFESFDQFLKKKKAVAFLIIKNDSLIYENYFAGYNESSIIPSFSTSKSFVSALVGIAIDEGFIESTNLSITHYLYELRSPDFDQITIEDLLNMRSGIKFNEEYYSPFADMAKYYYGTELKKYITKLKVEEPPNIHYNYISVNTLLLSLIVERATNVKLNEYCQQKLWKPLEMEFGASWSIDSEENQTIKSFCCINGRARDFAKFGRLYLNNGNWNGIQVVQEEWVKKSRSIINDSKDSQGYPYTYHWRVLENGCFFAKGVLGQYIFVNPDKNLIFVRMGEKYAQVDWIDLFLELSDQL